jgi:vacuolar-type H+-ATPase subunit D/Vma8
MTAPGGIRVPPGRAGRIWLERRLATAQHAGELLKEKLAILNHEEQRLAQRAAEGAEEWRRLCAESETWTLRAAVLSSRRALRIASDGTSAQADIAMGFTMGIEHPVSGAVRLERQQDLPVTGSAAVTRADALSRKPGHVGAIAFSRSGDPATGEFGDAKLIRKFGEVPDDLSAL